MYEPAWTPDSKNILVSRHSVATGLEPPPPSPESGSTTAMAAKGTWKSSAVKTKKARAGRRSLRMDAGGYFEFAAGDPSSYAGHDDPLQGFFQIKRIELRHRRQRRRHLRPGAQQYRLSNGGAFAPEISPDGRWLTFARRIPNGTISYKGHKYGPRTALRAPRSAIRRGTRPDGPDRKRRRFLGRMARSPRLRVGARRKIHRHFTGRQKSIESRSPMER